MTRHATTVLKIPALFVAVVFLPRTSTTLAQCELYEDAKLTASGAAGIIYPHNLTGDRWRILAEAIRTETSRPRNAEKPRNH